ERVVLLRRQVIAVEQFVFQGAETVISAPEVEKYLLFEGVKVPAAPGLPWGQGCHGTENSTSNNSCLDKFIFRADAAATSAEVLATLGQRYRGHILEQDLTPPLKTREDAPQCRGKRRRRFRLTRCIRCGEGPAKDPFLVERLLMRELNALPVLE